MPEDPDPKKVAEHLAGGSTLHEFHFHPESTIAGQWVYKDVDCPHCGVSNPATLRNVGCTIVCKNCRKEFRIIAEDSQEMSTREISKKVDLEFTRKLAVSAKQAPKDSPDE